MSQTVNRNHKEPKIFDIHPDNNLYKFPEDLSGVRKTQATRKSNITKVSNMIKVTLLEMEDNCFQGLDPHGSSITDAQAEIIDLQAKLRDSWAIYNDLNLRLHEILDDSSLFKTDAQALSSESPVMSRSQHIKEEIWESKI